MDASCPEDDWPKLSGLGIGSCRGRCADEIRCDVVEGTEADLVLRLAALFHDVGKPLTRGRVGTFYGPHESAPR
jgi:hypothetical protein